jgi:hypothetical protein
MVSLINRTGRDGGRTLLTWLAVDHDGIILHNKFMDFRWNDWKVEHIGTHGVSPEEAETVIVGLVAPIQERFRKTNGWSGAEAGEAACSR